MKILDLDSFSLCSNKITIASHTSYPLPPVTVLLILQKQLMQSYISDPTECIIVGGVLNQNPKLDITTFDQASILSSLKDWGLHSVNA